MAEHSSFVNSCCPSRSASPNHRFLSFFPPLWCLLTTRGSPLSACRRGNPLVVSGSDDGTAKVWDLRVRGSVQTLPDRYQITAVAFSDTADRVFSGGVDNLVKVWDLRQGKSLYELEGHTDTITGG